MKLYDRLKPEYQQEMEDSKENYPHLYDHCCEILDKEVLGNLTLFEVGQITSICNVTIGEIYNLFNSHPIFNPKEYI